jgi:hypothetical protein
MNLLTETVEKTKASLSGIAQAPGQLGNAAVEGTQKAVEGMIHTWMKNHPVWAWFASHPLISVGVVLVAFFLLRGLIGAIAHFVEQLWIVILRLPMKLLNWLLNSSLGTLRKSAEPSLPQRSSQQQELAMILDRLEAIQLEQDELLKQVKTILESTLCGDRQQV